MDIVIYALTCDIEERDLEQRLEREIAIRKLGDISSFTLPGKWGTAQARQYAKLCMQTSVPERFREIKKAADLSAELLNPALNRSCTDMHWNHKALKWGLLRG